MEEASESRYKSIENAFTKIESKLPRSNYNHDSRKKNRNYLEKYLRNKHKETQLVQRRRNKAEKLKLEIEKKVAESVPESGPESGPESEPESESESVPESETVNPTLAKAVSCDADSFAVTIRNSLINGDCFYSSVFRALKERPELLERVQRNFSINVSDESAFIQSWRNMVADKVETYVPAGKNGPLDFYDILINKSHDATGNIDIILKGFPSWFRSEFGENFSTVGSRDDFFRKLKQRIRTPTNWVGQIEVEIVQKLLESQNILVKIENNSARECAVKSRDGVDFIYLINYGETHYKYFSFDKEEYNSLSTVVPGETEEHNSVSTVFPGNTLPSELVESHESNILSTKAPAVLGIEKKTANDKLVESHNSDKERLLYLTHKLEKCKKECEQIKKEKKELDDFFVKKDIEGITLSTDKKLIDLLIERILDISPNWKHNIDTLINIPTALKGEGFLRGGDYFEALFQLAIAIGILPIFSNKFVRFFDIRKYKELESLPNYLYIKTIQNSGGGEQGISDITFEVSENIKFDETQINKTYECGQPPTKQLVSKNPFYFISVKGYKKEKSIKNEYDIPLLDQQIREFPDKNKHIIVCVRDKERFLENLSRTKIDFLKNSINYILGYEEIIDAFTKFRLNFFRKIQDNISTKSIIAEVHKLFPKDKTYKQSLSLYFHQELVAKSVINRIKEVNNPTKPHFLCIGVLPRGGKSFIAGGIIDAHKKIKAKASGYNILFLTSAVNETREQFQKDLIEKFSEFSDFEFVDVVNQDKKAEDKANKFYFISRQLSGKTEQEKQEIERFEEEKGVKEEIDSISKSMFDTLEKKLGSIPNFDIIFFDEAHIGITSKTVRTNFQKAFERFKIPIVLMTATYKKPAIFLESNKDLFVWDLQDIKDMKSLPTLELDAFEKNQPDVLQRYPDLALDILKFRINQGEELSSIVKPYNNFPNPNFISLTFSPETIRHLKDTSTGYDFTKAFELNIDETKLLDNTKYADWGSMIRNREDAVRLRQFMTPEQDLSDEDEMKTPFLQNKDRKYRALNQIFTIAQQHGSRPIQGKPFSILMFLPFGFGSGSGITKIGDLCRVWASFMLESKYWRENFVFLTLSTFNNKKYKKDPKITIPLAVERGLCHREDHTLDLKELIIEVEKEALRKGKGLVILSGDVAKMGISLKCVDVVFLMSNNKEADDIIQKMYRALTDDPPNKKDGFIVDLDLKRIITAMFEYDLEKDKMRIKNPVLPSVGERLNKVWELCNWGQDSFIEEHPEMDFNAIMDEIKRRVFGDLERKILHDFSTMREKIKEKQIQLIKEDDDLYREMADALKFTTGRKGKIPKPDKMADRGKDIPEEEVVPGEDKGDPKIANKHKPLMPPKPMLSDSEIENKMFSIITTFVNSLVIKSSEPWTKSLNLVSLLEKYRKDKELIKGVAECDCKKVENCKKQHDNIFETAFCELSSYAMVFVEKDKYEYDEGIHKKIMLLIEDVFKNSSILVEWNIYIENILRDIKTAKKVGGFKRTRKIKNLHRI